jgi:hypothetical protein
MYQIRNGWVLILTTYKKNNLTNSPVSNEKEFDFLMDGAIPDLFEGDTEILHKLNTVPQVTNYLLFLSFLFFLFMLILNLHR